MQPTQPTHATLEPNEHNTDGVAVTLYFTEGVTAEAVTALAKAKGGDFGGSLTVDVKDPYFTVDKTACPFPGFVRYQLHPTC